MDNLRTDFPALYHLATTARPIVPGRFKNAELEKLFKTAPQGVELRDPAGDPGRLFLQLKHADYLPDCPRVRPIEKGLYACDELAGFITATSLIKPNKSLAEVDAKSVRKRMKDKAFARSVSRDDIINGAADLGVDLDEHIAFCIEAMKGIAGELGLAGQPTPNA